MPRRIRRTPDTSFVMRAAEGPFPVETTSLWEDGPNGMAKMTLRNRGEPKGFSGIAAAVLAMAMKRANARDLARLQSLIEATN